MSSSQPSTSTPLIRLAVFGGALIAAVSLFTIYREWVRNKKREDDGETETPSSGDEANAEAIEAALAEIEAAQRAEDEARRRLLDEQDMEYVISEQLDAEKDRKRAADEEEKRQREVLEESRKLADLEARRHKLALLPPVPSTQQGANILDLTVMIPELENSPKKPMRESRRWNAEIDTMEDVMAWVETLALPELGAHAIPASFVLRSDFPRNRFTAASAAKRTLKSLGLTGRVILHIEETFDESS